jgi:hypothetical protein
VKLLFVTCVWLWWCGVQCCCCHGDGSEAEQAPLFGTSQQDMRYRTTARDKTVLSETVAQINKQVCGWCVVLCVFGFVESACMIDSV